ETGIRPRHFQRHDGSIANKNGKLVDREFAREFAGAFESFAIIEEIAPIPRRQRDCAREPLLVNWGNQEVIAEQLMKFSPREGPNQWPATAMTFNDVRVHVRNQFGVKPCELAKYFQLGRRTFPEPPFAMTAVEEKSA